MPLFGQERVGTGIHWVERECAMGKGQQDRIRTWVPQAQLRCMSVH